MRYFLSAMLLVVLFVSSVQAGPAYPVVVKNMPVMNVAYTEYIGDYDSNPEKFEELMNRLLEWAHDKPFFKFPKETKLVVAFPDELNNTASNKRRLQIAVTVPRGTEVSDGIQKGIMSGGRYAVGSFVVADDEMEQAWTTMFEKWLPESGHELGDGVIYQIQKNDPDQHPQGMNEIDICIPVRSKSTAASSSSLLGVAGEILPVVTGLF